MTKDPFDAHSRAFDKEIRDEDTLLQHAIAKGMTGLIQGIRFNRLFLAFWFKRYDEAAEMMELYKVRTIMPLLDAYHAFYSGLTAFHFARHFESEPKWMATGEKALSLYKIWARHSTWNWENKFYLMQAECHFCKGELKEAEEMYRLAINSARKHRFVHEEGLGHELLSVFYTSTGNTDKAKCHISEARTCYERWGAFALLDLLDSPEQWLSV